MEFYEITLFYEEKVNCGEQQSFDWIETAIIKCYTIVAIKCNGFFLCISQSPNFE